MLKKSIEFLNKKGRLVIISYHSLEDKIVKNFINKSSFSSDYNKDMYGRKEEFFFRSLKINFPLEEISTTLFGELAVYFFFVSSLDESTIGMIIHGKVDKAINNEIE